MTFTLADKNDIPQLTQLRIDFLKVGQPDIPEETEKTLKTNITAFFEKHLNKDAVVFIAREDSPDDANGNTRYDSNSDTQAGVQAGFHDGPHARHHGKIVSTAILNIIEKPANTSYIHGRVGEVNSVYTIPEYRRRGYALQIIKNLVQYSIENQIDRVDLKATKMGAPVYLKAGFEITEDTHTNMHFTNK
ncbi:GNAT family N-acetyltransferase [Treponema sp.]|uniref:GNAT family N-acetyltransferase n=1 Tax=Treponema sp. TaxID=166 RepID=UPI00298DE9C3|nr:GNAT family N-acetyltransferase [Treponema sp.]MCR5613321.1 GNAT family N-acetyltransferase [Treponema sp.]